MPDLLDFFMYCFYNNNYNYEFLGKTKKGAIVSNTVIKVLESFRKPARDALERVSVSRLLPISRSLPPMQDLSYPLVTRMVRDGS